MEPFVEQIWRHPVKSLGAEKVNSVTLTKGETLPWDRVWALTYENSRFDISNPVWSPCSVFLRGSIAPLFLAVTAKVIELDGSIEFNHPKLKSIHLNLYDQLDRQEFIKWVAPICPENAPKPSKLCRVIGRGMTDTDYPSISINSISSLTDLSNRMNKHLHPRRFRGNIWIDGLKPWSELELIGKQITVGSAKVEVIEPIVRCNATKTNEQTGVRDADTLGSLYEEFGHKNFGVYCKVISSGDVSESDLVFGI
jgi:uncharacterized protein YcbX